MRDILEDAENGLPGTLRNIGKTERPPQGIGLSGGRTGVADQAVA